MFKSEVVTLKGAEIDSVAGPLYSGGYSEDGMELGFFDYFVVVTIAGGATYSLGHSYSVENCGSNIEAMGRAANKVRQVAARGEVDLQYWVPGSPWDAFAPETREEERAREIEEEYGPGPR